MQKDENGWFISDYYVAAGRPKMEEALMQFALDTFLYGLYYEFDLDGLVVLLNKKQAELRAENGRLKEVSVRLGMKEEAQRGSHLRRLYVGEQWLLIRKVREDSTRTVF